MLMKSNVQVSRMMKKTRHQAKGLLYGVRVRGAAKASLIVGRVNPGAGQGLQNNGRGVKRGVLRALTVVRLEEGRKQARS